jgi:hypothetical protein
MRVGYLGTFVAVGIDVWSELINPAKPWDPIYGVAYSFWAAYSALMVLGVRYPLAMLPLLILQLLYKSVWFIAVARPLWSAGQLDGVARELTSVFAAALVFDLIVIPWPYVIAHYVRKPGDRWR